ncbi:MAG: hypothetical protein BI182_16630 [Acetobacterium sp. MES1]|uniref:GGDEF domain-containing protein n=1 Tax=Acetobacterium sp. MES1 TaxID=1899015 RepID=UPI000B9CA14F|nr:GGDEF domain-containing protein [Acetobacterium sp. MES1]OXS25321.1 MAG: hypothetical protein BI182_16630 [Acetobacterium sp. MES1]
MNLISLFCSVDLLIYSELILVYIFISLIRQDFRSDISHRLFIIITLILSVVNLLEGVTWILNGTTLTYGRSLLLLTNNLLIACNSLSAVIWVAYADYKIFNDLSHLKKHLKWYLVPFYITLILLFINWFTGIVFTIDSENIYARGIGLYFIVLMTYGMITFLYFRTRNFKQQINGKIMESIFLFMLIPIIAGVLQMFIYGILIIWPSFIFATLIAYIQIERDTFLRDPLTGLPSREQLEERFSYLSGNKYSFTIIMCDLNDFKIINDQYGHHEGDQALVTTANLLHHASSNHDNVYRFGGDEFIILLESNRKTVILDTISRIKQTFLDFNKRNNKPYSLSASFGYSIFDATTPGTLEDLIREADQQMYVNKNRLKNGKPDHFEKTSSELI